MSKTGVIVALIVALVLAAAALFMSGRTPKPIPTGPLLAFDPAKVTELRVAHGTGRYEAVRRGVQPGDWHVMFGGKGEERAWPANPDRMRAALRILSTLEASQEAEAGAALGPDAAELRLTLEDKTSRTMRISSRVLGGKILVEATGLPPAGSMARTAWVKSDIGDMLVTTGLREWRERSAVPGLGPDTARITLKGQQGTVALARVQGRWGLREPVPEAAEPEAVVKLLTALGSVQIADFLDDGAPAPERTGLDRPIAELTIEADRRDADGRSRSIRHGLKVGQQADIGGKTVFAAISAGGEEGAGAMPSRVVIVAAESLAALSTDWTTYVSRRSLQSPSADLGRVAIRRAPGKYQGGVVAIPPGETWTLERTLDGWNTVAAGAAPAPTGRDDVDALTALLNLLTQTPAESIRTAPTDGDVRLALVEVGSAGGTKIADLEAAVTGQDTREGNRAWGLVVRVGPVWRVYSSQVSRDPIAWLQRSR